MNFHLARKCFKWKLFFLLFPFIIYLNHKLVKTSSCIWHIVSFRGYIFNVPLKWNWNVYFQLSFLSLNQKFRFDPENVKSTFNIYFCILHYHFCSWRCGGLIIHYVLGWSGWKLWSNNFISTHLRCLTAMIHCSFHRTRFFLNCFLVSGAFFSCKEDFAEVFFMEIISDGWMVR